MAEQFSVDLTKEEVENISYVELAYEILNSSGNTFHYKDLLLEIGHRKGLSQEDLTNTMATIYSEINIDGRFLCIGQNVWGLKRWYPTEKTAKTGPTPKRFKRNDEDYDDYDLDDEFYLEDDEDYVADIDEDDVDLDIDEDIDGADVDDLDLDIVDDPDEDFDLDEADDEFEDDDDADTDEEEDLDLNDEDEDDNDR